MSTEVSLNTRKSIAIATYLGMGFMYSKTREFSRKHFSISQESPEKLQYLHDAAIVGALNLIITPAFYAYAGETDSVKIAIGTGASMITGIIGGGPMGLAIDAYEDLTGLQPSTRIPDILRRQSMSAKIATALALTGLSLILTKTVYDLTPYSYDTKPAPGKVIVQENISNNNKAYVKVDSLEQLVNHGMH